MEFSTLNGYKVKDKKAIRYYDTVADMKSDTTLKNGMYAKTKGYYSVNDGGGSEYHITSTESLTEYYETLNNNLYANLIIKDKVNVKQFGAKGNGDNDDTNSIQNCINIYNNIFIPKGTYLINNLSINKDNVKIYGENKNNTTLLNINEDSNAFNLIEINSCINVEISDLKIDGDKKGKNSPIAFINVNDCKLHDTIVTGGNDKRTINVQSFVANKGNNNKIYNNEVKAYGNIDSGALIECTGEMGTDEVLHYLNNIEIYDNKCIVESGTYIGNSDLFDCIEIDNTKNAIIDKNYCNSILHNGISVDTRNIDFRVTNNYCTNMTIHGIESTGSLGETKGIISNNVVDTVDTGISLNNPDVSVVGNIINNATTRGIIVLEGAQNCIISSNYINGANDGIYVSGSASLINIVGNKTLNIRNTNSGVVVPIGTGAGIEVYSTENNCSLTMTRIKGYNGVIINREPNQNNSLFIQDTRLRYKDMNGIIYTITKVAD